MKSSIQLLIVLLFATAPNATWADHHHENDNKPKLSFKKDGDLETVLIDGELFTAYNDKDTQKPYLYPIIGPTGANMTRNFPMKEGVEGESKDHPHHTSLWFAHGDVNGTDFWHKGNNSGLIHAPDYNITVGRLYPEKNQVKIADGPDWIDNNEKTLLNSITVYSMQVLGDGARVIDVSTKMSNGEDLDQIVFGDTKEGTMAIRLHPALRLKGKVATGHCINSEGDKDGAAWGKRAKWVAYWGVIDGKTCGVAVFDHPTNLRHPTWWHARDYGLVAANPFGQSDFEKKPKGTGDYTLKAGETLSLRYRFVFFAGDAEEADIKGKYAQWVKETTPDEAPADQEAGWTPLFNGEDLTGWTPKPGGEWKVVDGAIVGTSAASEKRHGLLVSEHAYEDFEARLKFKVTAGDSGFYFRSTPVDHVVGIKGFQAEVDRTMDTGGLYETLGRAWVKKPDADMMKKRYKPGQWTDMKVRAVGGHVTVWINGEKVTELKDDPGATKGHFALQLHGGQAMDVAFKDIAVREIK